MPATGETKKQFWSQSFRRAISNNAKVFKRDRGAVSWEQFPAFRTCIAESKNAAEAEKEVEEAQDFVLGFLRNINTRLGERNDLFFLEACTLFDARPEFKSRNMVMYFLAAYVSILICLLLL